MAKMTLGGYEFEWNPSQYTIPKEDKSYSVVQTYSSAAYFSWGTSIIGKEIVVEWEMMPADDFDQIQTLLEADAEVVWVPGNGSSYNVEVADLQGRYIEKSIHDAPYRERARCTLIIISEV